MVSNNEHNEEAEMNREDGGIAGLGMHPLPVARLGGMRREYFERMTTSVRHRRRPGGSPICCSMADVAAGA